MWQVAPLKVAIVLYKPTCHQRACKSEVYGRDTGAMQCVYYAYMTMKVARGAVERFFSGVIRELKKVAPRPSGG